jgi:hypothetical protein
MPCFLWNLNFCCCINKTLCNPCDRKMVNVLATIVEFLARHRIPNLEDHSLSSGHSWPLYPNAFSFIHSQSICHTIMKCYLLWFLCVFSIRTKMPVVSVRSTSTCNRCLAEPDAVLVCVFFVCCVAFDVYFFQHFTPHQSKSILIYFEFFFIEFAVEWGVCLFENIFQFWVC